MRLLQTALVLGLGLLILVMYFFPVGPLSTLQWALYDWAAVVVAAAWVLGFLYIAQHHWRGVLRRRSDWPARAVLLIALVSAFAVTLWDGPTGRAGRWLLEYGLIPAAASLFAVAGVVLTYRGLWLLQRRRNPLTWSFAIGVLVFMVADTLRYFTGHTAVLETLQGLQRWLIVPALRGLLLGLALGLITTAWRLLLGADRPYQDE